MLYGWLLDKNTHRCEPLTDLSYPVVLPQGGEGRGNRFIECLRGDLYGVLNVPKILNRNRAGSKNHVQERNIFAFCSPMTVAGPAAQCGREAFLQMCPAAKRSIESDFNTAHRT